LHENTYWIVKNLENPHQYSVLVVDHQSRGFDSH